MQEVNFLKDKNGEVFYPMTVINAVYDDNGNNLTNVLGTKTNNNDIFSGTQEEYDLDPNKDSYLLAMIYEE